MNRIDRLMAMITVLQSKKFVTAEFLSSKFEISIRTVYRDIKALTEIGVPISFESHKGYFIFQSYFLPPVTFSIEEANALVLMETLVDQYADLSIKENYENALNKIKSILKDSQKEKIEYLHSQIKIYKNPKEQIQFKYLSIIQHAIINKIVLTIKYENNQNKKTIREIEPIGLTYYGFDWHIIAWCWLRNEYRDFKSKHILNLVDTQKSFKKKKHIDINQYIKSLH